MIKQYRITTENLPNQAMDDCALSEDDPIHDMIAAQYLGGLNAAVRINDRKQKILAENEKTLDPLKLYAQQYNIKPGTPAYHALMGDAGARSRKNIK